MLAALRVAAQLGPDATVVTIAVDSGLRYLEYRPVPIHCPPRPFSRRQFNQDGDMTLIKGHPLFLPGYCRASVVVCVAATMALVTPAQIPARKRWGKSISVQPRKGPR